MVIKWQVVLGSAAFCLLIHGQQVQTKFTLRNLSGDSVGVWWLEPSRKKLVPQASVAVRNSSSIEVNSFRSHEFVIRPLPFKTPLKDMPYYKTNDEVIMIVGATNDIVILDDDFKLIRHDARFELQNIVRSALALPSEDARQRLLKELVAAEAGWHLRWQEEVAFRLAMEEDLVALGGDLEKDGKEPVPPPGGWPNKVSAEAWASTALETCTKNEKSPPVEPAWYSYSAHDDCSAWTHKYKEAEKYDEHAWCGRWARIGECENNPNYMLLHCSRFCDLWNDMGQPLELSVDDLLIKAEIRDSYIDCIAQVLEPHAARLRGAISAEHNARTGFAESLRNLTCAQVSPLHSASVGPHMNTSQEPTFFYDEESKRKISAKHLFRASTEMPAANISLFTQFATDDECQHIIATAKSSHGGFQPATVNQEDDSAALSLSRRASAGVVKPDPDDMYDPSARLWRRAIHLANFMTGYELDAHGQEPFSVIYYNGSKPKTPEALPDEYRPHCDGGCDGSPHLHGGRVATLLLYCQTATRGGTTTFTNARTVAAPKANDAVFFSYYDKHSGLMDTGQTTHSGCPVLEGDKFVVTLWLRKGVSRNDSWTQYDPTGARHDPRGKNPNL